jgi:hypothetical protein
MSFFHFLTLFPSAKINSEASKSTSFVSVNKETEVFQLIYTLVLNLNLPAVSQLFLPLTPSYITTLFILGFQNKNLPNWALYLSMKHFFINIILSNLIMKYQRPII